MLLPRRIDVNVEEARRGPPARLFQVQCAQPGPAPTLAPVKVTHADEAEEVFSTLMGDLVEPRRDFIQANALNVANLDV